MQYLEVPESPSLSGEKAIEALYHFVDDLEKQQDKDLTETIDRILNEEGI